MMIELASSEREVLIDLTDRVRRIVEESGVRDGICCVYAHGATAAVMIQENCDASVPTDVVDLLRKAGPARCVVARPGNSVARPRARRRPGFPR